MSERSKMGPSARHASFNEREGLYLRLLPAGFAPQSILDIGATAATVSFLSGRFPGASIAAQNIKENAVDQLPAAVRVKRVGRAEKLDFEDDRFDLLFVGEVLEHLTYPNEFLAEASRVLVRDGLLLLSTPNLASWHNRLLILFGYSPSNYSMIPERHLGLPRFLRNRAGLG